MKNDTGENHMDTRRNFIKKSAILCAALSLPLPFRDGRRLTGN